MQLVIQQLKALDAAFPAQRKLLLVPNINLGRELLAAVALEQGSWIGWEVATLASVAQKLAVVELAERKLRNASDVALADTVSGAFDAAIRGRFIHGELANLEWSAGARRAIRDAILELRTAGVTPAMLLQCSDVRSPDSAGNLARNLSAILAQYDLSLARRHLADPTEQFEAALKAFDEQAPFVLDHTLMVCSPGWTVRGRPGELFKKLAGRGLRVLIGVRVILKNGVSVERQTVPEGLVDDLAPAAQVVVEEYSVNPNPTMFCAATTADEIREVLRRVVGAGVPFDQVEIASLDQSAYASTHEALCEQLSISTTIFDGIPFELSRIGRTVSRWFAWIESDFQADVIRSALDANDFPADPLMSMELRRLRIGWGLDATRRAAGRLRSEDWRSRSQPTDGEPADEYSTRRDAQLQAMDQLGSLLDLLIVNAPPLKLSVAELAQRTTNILAIIIAVDAAEGSTLQRVRERLNDIASVPRGEVELQDALATLRQELSDLRVWTSASKTNKPRRATGGHVHFTNIENAGATGRSHLFIVGLDADRCAGPVMQSPLLPDTLRLRLNGVGAGLATTEERRRERAWQLHSAIAATRAHLTLSYAVRGGADGRDASPAPILLRVARRNVLNDEIGYEGLRAVFGPPVTAIPTGGSANVDARDVWFAAMSDGALLLDAKPIALTAFDGLRRGARAREARLQPVAGEFQGVVPAAGKLDARETQRTISPSSLETLATCSMRWFYNVALGARKLEEPEFDPLVWLNPLDRGSVLHEIYERVMKGRLHEQPSSVARDREIELIVNNVLSSVERRIPAPGEVVKAREIVDLHNNAKLFVTTEHDGFVRDPFEVVGIEVAFGDEQVATFPLPDGSSIRVHGRVDRVDKLADGTLRLIDYKTGRSFELDSKRGAFDGGRKLQLSLYSPAVTAVFNADVSTAEYRFPTEKGDGIVARASLDELALAPRIVQSLMRDVGAGLFLPTVSKDDCRYCDYASVCRVKVDRYDFESPRAEWAKESARSDAQFEQINFRTTRIGDSE
ncbi:MAG: PD-(D/E)XK nuclease family protein [Gemmatimonadaceae bacterium]